MLHVTCIAFISSGLNKPFSFFFTACSCSVPFTIILHFDNKAK